MARAGRGERRQHRADGGDQRSGASGGPRGAGWCCGGIGAPSGDGFAMLLGRKGPCDGGVSGRSRSRPPGPRRRSAIGPRARRRAGVAVGGQVHGAGGRTGHPGLHHDRFRPLPYGLAPAGPASTGAGAASCTTSDDRPVRRQGGQRRLGDLGTRAVPGASRAERRPRRRRGRGGPTAGSAPRPISTTSGGREHRPGPARRRRSARRGRPPGRARRRRPGGGRLRRAACAAYQPARARTRAAASASRSSGSRPRARRPRWRRAARSTVSRRAAEARRRSASAPAASARTAISPGLVVRGHRAHLDRVGDQQPVEAELPAQQPGQDAPAERRGHRRVQRGDEQVRRTSPAAPRPRSRPGTAAGRARASSRARRARSAAPGGSR